MVAHDARSKLATITEVVLDVASEGVAEVIRVGTENELLALTAGATSRSLSRRLVAQIEKDPDVLVKAAIVGALGVGYVLMAPGWLLVSVFGREAEPDEVRDGTWWPGDGPWL